MQRRVQEKSITQKTVTDGESAHTRVHFRGFWLKGVFTSGQNRASGDSNGFLAYGPLNCIQSLHVRPLNISGTEHRPENPYSRK